MRIIAAGDDGTVNEVINAPMATCPGNDPISCFSKRQVISPPVPAYRSAVRMRHWHVPFSTAAATIVEGAGFG